MTPSTKSSLVLAGRLEAISLGDALQVLATAGRDGVLTVEREDPQQWGEIELVDGRVVRAEVSHLPDRVSSVLLRRRALDPDALGEALRRQSAAYAWRSLGAVLLEMQLVDRVALAEALADQIGEHTAVMMSWERGVFRFRTGPGTSAWQPAGLESIGLDAREVLLQAARRSDEARMH